METPFDNKTAETKSVFLGALEIEDTARRAAYLAEACGADAELRRRVESLLKAHEQAGGFLQLVAFDPQVRPEESPLTEATGTVIGRYKLLEKIGEGGMAVVYMAEQAEPIRRKVALKIIKLGMDTRLVIARFEAERQALALMDHPCIAKVLDAGATETGRPYFVMELVQGVSITEYCDENRLSTKERLALFLQVCQAVQHAHTKGIIHRDIKPSNVMVTHHDGQPLPKVIDFGIAKATNQKLTEKTLFTRYAHIIGTPAYMSPEQAELSDLEIDTRSDIYSLGVLLYELLTGITPFSEEELRKAGYLEMRRVIREQEPVKPSTKLSTLGETLTDIAKHRSSTPDLLKKAVRGELDWIVMKSLEKDRVRRYETADSLALDIRRYLEHEPVMARPPGNLYRLQKLVQRNRGVFGAVTVLAAVLLLAVFVSTWQAALARRAERAETRLRHEAQANELAMRQLAYASDISLAQHALATNDLGRARRLLEDHTPRPGEVDLRGWEWRYLWQECRTDAVGELCRHSNEVFSVAYSPDGRLLALAGLAERFVEIWDVSEHRRLATLQSSEGHLVAFSPREDLLATDATGGQIRLWRMTTMDLAGQLALPGAVQVLRFSPDGTKLAGLSESGELVVWEVGSWTTIQQIHGVHCMGIHLGRLDFSPDGKALVIGDADHRLRVVDLASGNTKFDIPNAHPEPIASVAWSPNGSVIASGSGYAGGPIRLWDAASGQPLGAMEGHTSGVCRLTFSRNGLWLYSASGDQTIRIWDVVRQRCLATLRGSTDVMHGLTLSPDGTTLASSCRDGVVAFWNASPRTEVEPLALTTDRGSFGPAFAPDSRVLAVRSEGTVSLFDLATRTEMEPLPVLGTNDIRMVTYSPDGTLLAGGSQAGKIRVWSCLEHRLLHELEGAQGPIHLLRFRSDGTRLLSIDATARGVWWDTSTWQAAGTFSVESPGAAVAISPDGRLLAVAAKGVQRWLNAETGELLATTASPHRRVVGRINFSGDGSRAASVADDGTVAIWNASSFQLIATFKGYNMSGAHGVGFSPDGRTLATAGGGRDAVKLWDLSTRRQLVTLPAEDSQFSFVEFSPDGKWLAARGMEGKLYLWRAPSWAEIEAEEKRPESGPSP